MKITTVPISLLAVMFLQFAEIRATDIPSWGNGGNGLVPGAHAAMDWADASRVV